MAQSGDQVRRLFHGRGGLFEGLEWLVIDWLPPVAVIRVYASEVPQPLDPVVEHLMAQSQVGGVVLQLRGRGREAQSEVLAGDVPEKLVVEELGLRYQVRPLQNQNSGLFLDMRPGRAWVRDNASGARVLNLFAYTCAFSVAAMAGGAQSVVNLDMSSGALSVGRRNHQLNGIAGDAITYMALDLLRSWSRVRRQGPYDLILIDPPSFQPGSFVAERDYRKVLRRLDELTLSGSRVLACHNDPGHSEMFLREMMASEAPGFEFQQRLPLAEGFPERNPEQGLKALLYKRVDA
nr:class I SAM-dependent methyltransferase [Marinobacterium ramblicola]